MSTSKFVQLLNKLIIIVSKTFIVLFLLLSGMIVLSVRMAGLDIYRKPELKEVYRFDKLGFTIDDVDFVVDDGRLVTIARAGNENALVILGRGQISWYREPRLKTFTKLLISLNSKDLESVMTTNQESLERLLKFEADAIDARRKARSFLSEEHLNQFHILGIPALSFTFLGLPPPGEIDFDIYDRDQDLGDYMSNYERANQSTSAWKAVMGSVFSILFLATGFSVFLFIILIPTVFLTYVAPAVSFILSNLKGTAYQKRVGISPIINLGLSILLVASLILILQVL